MVPEPFVSKVRFDGKHWIGKKRPNESLDFDYANVVKQARKNLGPHGIVAIPNARPDEYRFEEFVGSGDGYGLKDYLDTDGRVFYDGAFGIYFIKAQEVRTELELPHKKVPLVFLAYNLPFGKNLSDKSAELMLEEANIHKAILGLNLPSCFKGVDESLLNLPDLFGKLDFVVGYSGGAALNGLGVANFMAQKIYEDDIRGTNFDNSYTGEKHKVGITAVSGGHRTPQGKLEEFLNGGQTIGSSYTEIKTPNPNFFMEDLREKLRKSKVENMHCEPIIVEAIKSQLSIKVGDRLRKMFS